MRRNDRRKDTSNCYSQPCLDERVGAQLGATGIAAQIPLGDLRGGAEPRHAVVEDGAKQKFVEDCILDLTLDFSAWCGSCVAPDGSFDPVRRCAYCYAKGNKLRFPKTRSVDSAMLAAQLKRKIQRRAETGLPTRCLRLGKKTDAGHPIFRSQLVAVLRACAEVDLPVVLPTKYGTFDAEIAAMMIGARAIFMPSLGADVLEPGALLWGMDQNARIKAGRDYQNAGVTVAPFVLIDPTQPLGGDLFRPVVGAVLRLFDRVQLLPIRLHSKVLARQVLGGWEELVNPGPNGEPPRFEASKNGTRIPLRYHPSITSLIGDNTGPVRMCAHNSMKSHCGACFVPGEVGAVTHTVAPLARTRPPISDAVADLDDAEGGAA